MGAELISMSLKVNRKTFDAIVAEASHSSCGLSDAVDLVVSEWAESKNKEKVHELAFSLDANNIIERVTALERQSKALFRAIEADRRSQSID